MKAGGIIANPRIQDVHRMRGKIPFRFRHRSKGYSRKPAGTSDTGDSIDCTRYSFVCEFQNISNSLAFINSRTLVRSTLALIGLEVYPSKP